MSQIIKTKIKNQFVLWREKRLIYFALNPSEVLAEDEDRWAYLSIEELDAAAGSLAQELLPDVAEVTKLREKKDQGITLAPAEEDRLKGYNQKDRQHQRLQALIAIKQSPQYEEYLRLNETELQEIIQRKAGRQLELSRKKHLSDTDKAELSQLQSESQILYELSNLKKSLTVADAQILKTQLDTGRVPSTISPQRQEKSLEEFIASAPDHVKKNAQSWQEHTRIIVMQDELISDLNDLLKRFESKALTIEDKKEIFRIYQDIATVHEKIGKSIDMDTLTREADEEIRARVTQHIEELEEIKNKEYKALIEKMESDLQERIKDLRKFWNNSDLHPSLKVYKSKVDKDIQGLETTLSELRVLYSLPTTDPKYQALIKKIATDEKRKQFKKEQIDLLTIKKQNYDRYIRKAKLALTNAAPTTDPRDMEIYKNLNPRAAHEAAKAWLSTNGHATGALTFPDTTGWDAIAASNPAFKPLFDEFNSRQEKQQFFQDQLTSYSATQTVTEQQLNLLRTSDDHMLFNDQDHYRMHLLLEDEIRKVETHTIDAQNSTKDEEWPEEVPAWDILRTNFSEAYEKKRQIFDRGAPKEEASPYHKAIEEIDKIKEHDLVKKMRDILNSPEHGLTPEQVKQIEETLNNLEKNLPALYGLESAVDGFKSQDYTRIFERDTPPNDPDVLKELGRYVGNFTKVVQNAEELITVTDGLADHMEKFLFSVTDRATNYGSINTSSGGWASIADLIKMSTMFTEWWERMYARNQQGRTGIMGDVVFGAVGLKTLAQDARLQQANIEKETVNKYKDAFDQGDAWAIWDQMHTFNHRDYLKAGLYSLADKGRIRFDNPILWRALNKFSGGAISFDYDNPTNETNDFVRLEDKISKAVIVIWNDQDLFNTLKNNNESHLKTNMKSYEDRAAQCSSNETGLQQSAAQLLQKWVECKQKDPRSHPPGFDPSEYEEYIRYAIEAGKMDGHAKFYYLVQGVKWGILSRQRLGAFSQDFSAKFSSMEFFDFHKDYSWIEEISELDGPPNSYQPGIKFTTWYHNYMNQHDRIWERTSAFIGGGGKPDHDDVVSIVTGMDEAAMTTLLTWRSGGERFRDTGVQNMAVGLLFGMQTKGMQINKNAPAARKILKRSMTSVLRYLAITESFMGQEDRSLLRLSYPSLQSRPRQWSSFIAQYNTTGESINKIHEYVNQLDPTFFSMIFDKSKMNFVGEASKKKCKAHIQQINQYLRENYNADETIFKGAASPETPDQLFEVMGKIIDVIIDHQSQDGGNVERFLKHIQEDIQSEEKKGRVIKGAYDTMNSVPPPPYYVGKTAKESDRAPILERPVHTYRGRGTTTSGLFGTAKKGEG